MRDRPGGGGRRLLVHELVAEDAPRGLEFLYDPHRFDVATSRARGVVIVVASPRLFEAECRTPAQMRMVNELCQFRELARVVK